MILVEELTPEASRYHDEGYAALERRDWSAALESFDRLIEITPQLAEVHHARGRALFALGHPQAALASYERSLALKPDYAESHNFRGAALGMLGDVPAARACFERALALKPEYAEAHFNLGIALVAEGDLRAALESFDRTLSLKPDYAGALINRGYALEALGDVLGAIVCYERALQLHPELPGAMRGRGNAAPTAPISTAPKPSENDYARARYNRALCVLSLGRFCEGWREHEWRWPAVLGGRLALPAPLWTGSEPLAGKIILVQSEQGVGDNIQFSRYIPLLQGRGARVLYGLGPNLTMLRGLFSGLGAAFEFVDMLEVQQGLHSFDYHCPLMSLPLAFGTDLLSIPPPATNLSAPAARSSSWRRRLGTEGFRIGIAWQGNPQHLRDRQRSFPLSLFAEIAAIEGVRLINLHKGTGEAQIAQAPFPVENFSAEIGGGAQGWLDTAALASACDVVICCDTAVAHLAGTLGLPVWLVLPYAAEWRWLRERADSPWYPSMRLFRQCEPDNWPSAFAELRSAVTRAIAERARDRSGSTGQGRAGRRWRFPWSRSENK